jgi:hypothetical protein
VEPIAQPATSFTGWPVSFVKVSRQEGGIRDEHRRTTGESGGESRPGTLTGKCRITLNVRRCEKEQGQEAFIRGRALVFDWAPIQEVADPAKFFARICQVANIRARERISSMKCRFTSLRRIYGMG